jgi:hypothetical protein
MRLDLFRKGGRLGRILLWWVGATAGLAVAAGESPVPPASPLNNLVRRLTEQRAAQAAAAKTPSKQELLRPEFKFTPAKDWLFLPELAKQLTTNETERAAVYNLLDQGAREANRLLAAEGADNEVAAATTLFVTQLWGVVRQQEPAAVAVDALHAQLVALLAGPEMAKMSNTDKQRYWEFCIGFPVFVLGMKEVATEPAAQADLRTIAATGFAALIGVRPELLDIGPRGLVLSAAAEAELEKTKAVAPAAVGSGGAGVPGITYTAPAGWSRENANGATIFRATLVDVDDNGAARRTSQGRHNASIFVLPPRAITQDVRTTFDAVWREQFDAFELGDTIVHYRGRVKSGLVIHYMGRFFNKKVKRDHAFMNYAVLYLVDLGGGRVQPIVAHVEPNGPSNGMGTDSFKESYAYRALSWPIFALLDSIQPAGGRAAPYPAGGYFAASDLQGDWGKSSSAVGVSYVNATTGASAGFAMNASSGTFGRDGTYDYFFAYDSSHPQFGSRTGSDQHSGRYRLDGDIVLVEPSQPINYKFTCCAVGIGTRQTRDGVKRILVTVSADNNGVFRGPAIFPNWDSYAGAMSWYVEK